MKGFENIIGYEAVVRELERIADVLRNPGYYTCLGVAPPHGLLLYGEPGVGKTTMAKALIEASGRPSFLCRRDLPDGEFIGRIRQIFGEAAENAPSIVFLDDLDKYSRSENGCSNEEEFVTVQTCMDNIHDKDVFVLATVNETDILPESLTRPGRFDAEIMIDCPSYEESVEIIRHYLKGKPVSPDADAEVIAGIFRRRSVAELEAAVQAAGFYAGFERSGVITMRHLIIGSVETVLRMPFELIVKNRPDDPDDPGSKMAVAACHEAGHVVVSEILRPGSVMYACINDPWDGARGCVSYSYDRTDSLETLGDKATCLVAGAAAVEVKFGIKDTGAGEDLGDAYKLLERMISSEGYCGLNLIRPWKSRFASEAFSALNDQAVAQEMTRHYDIAKKILASNRIFSGDVAAELLKHGLLTSADIRRIRESGVPKAG